MLDHSEILGRGLQLTSAGFVPKYCMKSAQIKVQGGNLEIEIIRIDDKIDLRFLSNSIRTFTEESWRQAILSNKESKKIFSFLLRIKLKNRTAYLDYLGSKLRDDIQKILSSGHDLLFYDNCGTHFIDSVVFDSSVSLFLALYYDSKDQGILNEMLQKIKGEKPANSYQIEILHSLPNYLNSFLSMRMHLAEPYLPKDFYFPEIKVSNIDVFLKNIIQNLYKSEHGAIVSFEKKSWSEFSGISSKLNNKKTPMFRWHSETIFNEIYFLRDEIFQQHLKMAEIFLYQKKIIKKLKKNPEIQPSFIGFLIRYKPEKTWNHFYKCRDALWRRGEADIQSISYCKTLLSQLEKNKIWISEYGRTQQPNISATSPGYLSSQQLYPFLLQFLPEVKKNPRSKSLDSQDTLFQNQIQYRQNPPLGIGFDMQGRVYKSFFFKKDDDGQPETDQIVHGTSYQKKPMNMWFDYNFQEAKKSSWIYKIFLFWKSFPGEHHYQGAWNLEYRTEQWFPEQKLKSEEIAMIKKNPVKFFQNFGTHFLQEKMGKSGLIIHFAKPAIAASAFSEKERRNRLKLLKFQLYGLPSHFLKSIHQPDSVEELLDNFDPRFIQKAFANSSPVATKLALTPWIRYFLASGQFSESELDPFVYFMHRFHFEK